MKKIILGVGGLVALLGLVLVASQVGWISIPFFSGRSESRSASPGKEEIGPIVKLSPLVINLKDESERAYLKTTIALELAKKSQVDEVTKSISLLTDIVILSLGEKRLEELKQAESKEHLKQELLSKMNRHFPPETIKRLYFDEFLYE